MKSINLNTVFNLNSKTHNPLFAHEFFSDLQNSNPKLKLKGRFQHDLGLQIQNLLQGKKASFYGRAESLAIDYILLKGENLYKKLDSNTYIKR